MNSASHSRLSICYLATKALAAHQLSAWAEWRISDLLSKQDFTSTDLDALNRLMDALERGEVSRCQTGETNEQADVQSSSKAVNPCCYTTWA
ncbi:hypothetical protein [Leptolyngbya sp. FACHB-261]|uniref:hypothetical protein n=1 Tax=Leptolyngbya sp. FACHB-261 TaxID=2692806 RepID=UPI0016840C3B|nr:hypothetical protein [Leptolyngbya sp. FACHB-261]MBD2102780.1 hypothetical protein [Leptolyngbya sp. FACHB-261]